MSENHVERLSELMSPIKTEQITLFNSVIQLNKLFYSFEKIKELSGCDEAFLVMIYKVCKLDCLEMSKIEKKMDSETKKRMQLFENIYKITNGLKVDNANTNSKIIDVEEKKTNAQDFVAEELNSKTEDSLLKKRKREDSIPIEENVAKLQHLESKDKPIFSNFSLLLSKEEEQGIEDKINKLGKLKAARVFKEFVFLEKSMLYSIIETLETKTNDPIISKILTLLPIFIKYDQVLFSVILFPTDFKAFDRQQLFRDLFRDKERMRVKLNEFTLLQKNHQKLMGNPENSFESQTTLPVPAQVHEHENIKPVAELEVSRNGAENETKNNLSFKKSIENIIDDENATKTIHSESRVGSSNFDNSKWVGGMVIDISEDEIVEVQANSRLYEKEEEIRILKDQIEKLEREKLENLNNKKMELKASSRAEEICGSISKKRSQMDKVNIRCSELNRDIDDLMKQIDRSQAELSQSLEILDVLQLEIEQEEIKWNSLRPG